MRLKIEKNKETEFIKDSYYREDELRGLRMSQLLNPTGDENGEEDQLEEETERKIIEVLLKDVMPTLSPLEGAALKRFVS